jgi:hypothetical protein
VSPAASTLEVRGLGLVGPQAGLPSIFPPPDAIGPMSPTTTLSGPTAVWISGRRTRGRIRPASLPIACVSKGGMCWVG